MHTLTIDIESIPSQKPGLLEEIKKTIQPPGNITKPESIAKWIQENAAQAAEEKYRKTALDGTLGEIVCIGWKVDDEPADVLYVDKNLPHSRDERTLLDTFFNMVEARMLDGQSHYPPFQFVGHNILNFDLRFIYQRCVINKIEPFFPMRQDSRGCNEFLFDTMISWAGWGNRVKLSTICDVLGIPVKTGDITGANVWDAVQAGRISEVSEYCREDVNATYEVYRAMTFQERKVAA